MLMSVPRPPLALPGQGGIKGEKAGAPGAQQGQRGGGAREVTVTVIIATTVLTLRLPGGRAGAGRHSYGHLAVQKLWPHGVAQSPQSPQASE